MLTKAVRYFRRRAEIRRDVFKVSKRLSSQGKQKQTPLQCVRIKKGAKSSDIDTVNIKHNLMKHLNIVTMNFA